MKIYIQSTPLDWQIMYGAKAEPFEATQQYLTQLESKGVLSLVATGTYLYNMLVPKENRIKLQVYPESVSKAGRSYQMNYNWRRLNKDYDDAKFKNPLYNPMNMKEMLIKYWWMAYYQLPKFNQSGNYLTWNHFINDLKQLSAVISKGQEPINNGETPLVSDTVSEYHDMPQLLPSNKDFSIRLLQDWGLQQYTDILINQQGYEDVYDWKNLKTEDLTKIGFKIGHASYLIIKAKEYLMVPVMVER